METSLRLILLIVGVVILGFVIWDVFKKRSKQLRAQYEYNLMKNLTPEFEDESFDNKEKNNITDKTAKNTEIAGEDFLAVNIMARDPNGFNGLILLKEFNNAGMEFGQWNIFHKKQYNKILFSVASSKEPGTLKKDFTAYDYLPGLTLFFVVSQSFNPQLALKELINFAKKISVTLNGELLDKHGQPLILQKLASL